ncbi:MAG TPA: ABC transporter ATP-binding protein [Lachnospiraceae bacterium]|nr:ABC transporter ATP-binding protein [Lachnospiraceae bacterium]
MIILQTDSLTKSYGRYPALNSVNLTVETGKVIGLLGPNGSGKTTLLKIIAGLLTPTSGSILIGGEHPGVVTKQHVSFLPDTTFFPTWMRAKEAFELFDDFYEDFNMDKALDMLSRLDISPDMRLKKMSKGTLEKVQLITAMSREANLYCLDEPIGGVDPATRDYILNTIITNYSENASVLISTHLISDIENVLDEVIFLQKGEVKLHSSADEIREKEGKSIDALFREVFACWEK